MLSVFPKIRPNKIDEHSSEILFFTFFSIIFEILFTIHKKLFALFFLNILMLLVCIVPYILSCFKYSE